MAIFVPGLYVPLRPQIKPLLTAQGYRLCPSHPAACSFNYADRLLLPSQLVSALLSPVQRVTWASFMIPVRYRGCSRKDVVASIEMVAMHPPQRAARAGRQISNHAGSQGADLPCSETCTVLIGGPGQLRDEEAFDMACTLCDRASA